MTTKRKSPTTKVSRNHGIDLLRGICMLGIIWHHTCLYSGGTFVPNFIKQLSFLLEVPALFFVSGITYKYINRDILINNIMKLSFGFTLIALILNGLFGSITLLSILNPLFFVSFKVPEYFYVLNGSYWFVSIYVIILIAASIILNKMHALYPLILIICFGIYAIPQETLPLSSFSICFLYDWAPGIFFLLGFFLLGYWYFDHPNLHAHKYLIAGITLLIGICLYILCYLKFGNNVFELWYHKDHKTPPYIIAAFLSIILLILIYSPQRKNFLLERIGACSIFYYIGQGISTSFLKFIEPHLDILWGIKLILMYSINIILCIICSELYMKIYMSISLLYHKLAKES